MVAIVDSALNAIDKADPEIPSDRSELTCGSPNDANLGELAMGTIIGNRDRNAPSETCAIQIPSRHV